MSDTKTETSKYAVLYVDDEEQALKYFQKGLKDFRVLTAPGVAQALTILEKEAASIAVVITDQRMPGSSGVSLLTQVRERWPAIVRILITAYTDIDSAVAAVNSGAVYKYVNKPADFSLLRQVLTEAMAVHKETLHRDALAETLRQLEEQRKATQEAEAGRALMQQKLIAASREAGRAEVATGILHNVGNVLNSMNVAAATVNHTLEESRVDNLCKGLAMLEEHAGDIAGFISTDERGQRLPGYLIKLAPVLKAEHGAIADAMAILNRSIEHIVHVVRTQQNGAKELIVEQSVRPSALMDGAVELSQSAIASGGVKIVREYADIPPLLLDQHRVLQILINLVSNAVRAVCDKPDADRQVTLRVETGTAESLATVRFAVVDNGTGIAAENLTRIFTYGFTTKSDGHGFGLHSAANAAKEMGGSLVVTSEGIGRGTTFVLEFPMRQAPIEPAAAQAQGRVM